MKVSKTYRIHKDNVKSLEEAVKVINNRLGCNAYDNTKVIESLISLYLQEFVDKVYEQTN